MKVAETFISINGEGTRAGELAVFIRFTGCNLNCSYCDTAWANAPDCPYEEQSPEELYAYVVSTGIRNVTLTGGEPLLQPQIGQLLALLAANPFLRAEVETNGSVSLEPFCHGDKVTFTMDYKLPSSGCEEKMLHENFRYLSGNDTVKFVSGSKEDLERAAQIIEEYKLTEKCHVYFSPVFGNIEPVQIVVFLAENKMNDARVQLQLHKLIWDPDKRGV